MKRILMIAFHYPLLRGSSGIQRTLKFSRYLPEYGWQPLILTASSKAYAQIGDELLGEIPAYVPVQRAFALDTARHLAFRGAYLSWMALPDRWVSWWLGGVLNRSIQHWHTLRSARVRVAAPFRAHSARYPGMEGDTCVQISCGLI